jgi:cytidylate kinase
MPDSAAVPVITIDGPGGSGKGTVSMLLAKKLGWNLLDSGALYRLVATAAVKRDIAADDEAALGALAGKLNASFSVHDNAVLVLLDGENVTQRLRSEEVSVFASRIATLPKVRAGLVDWQRSFRKAPGLVADGRDMGTVIFPDANLKIFLTASAEVRARRRYKQLKEKGESVNLSRLFHEIEERDERDRSRSISPLKPALDSHSIDSSALSVDQVLEEVLKKYEKVQVSD